MRIHWYDRILLLIMALFMLAVCALFVGLLYPVVQTDVATRIMNLPVDRMGTALVVGGAIIVAVLAVYLFSVCLGRRKPPAPKHIVVRNTDVGEVDITLYAIDTLIQKCARQYPAVKDCVSQVVVTPYGDLAVQLRLSLMPDAIVPDLSAQIQAEIKEHIQTHTGVVVREIRIIIESTGVNPASRVQ